MYCRPKQDSFILTWSWPKKLVTTNYNKMYCFPRRTHTPSSVMVIQRALTGTYRYHILLDTFFFMRIPHNCVLLSNHVQNVTGQFCGHFGGLFWLKYSLDCILMQLTNIKMVLIKLKFTTILIGNNFFFNLTEVHPFAFIFKVNNIQSKMKNLITEIFRSNITYRCKMHVTRQFQSKIVFIFYIQCGRPHKMNINIA